MRRTLTFVANFYVLLVLIVIDMFATHHRGGFIVYRHVSGNTYEVEVHIWTKYSSFAADQNDIEIKWGDGTIDTIPRVFILDNQALDTRYNIFKGTHTYPGPFNYKIEVEAALRDADPLNIPNADQRHMYLSAEIIARDPVIYGYNNSPVMYGPGVVTAVQGQPFIFPIVAYDPDLDSLSFKLDTPRIINGFAAPGYLFPDNYAAGSDSLFIDTITGIVYWLKPDIPGHFNFAVEITEFRYGQKIGSVFRDIRVIVFPEQNNMPEIRNLMDTCVWAGDILQKIFTIVEPDANPVYVNIAGNGPLEVDSLPTVSVIGGNPDSFSVLFSWKTTCYDIRQNPYDFLVVATDSPLLGNSLTNAYKWFISVLGPPDSLWASFIQPNHVRLQWQNPYVCDTASNFAGWSIWRRIGSLPGIDTCKQGVDGWGYTRIARFVKTYQFIDSFLSSGHTYCYRIVPEFFDTVIPGYKVDTIEGVASNEACIQIPRIIPVLTTASVLTTDSFNGKVLVKWMRPDSSQIDKTIFPPPYTIELQHGPGFYPNTWTTIYSNTYTYFSEMTDTTFIDSLINTATTPWAYKINFYSGTTLIGTSSPATTHFLLATPGDKEVQLQWQAFTPWINYKYTLKRRLATSSTYDSITNISLPFYTDKDVQNNITYCYVIQPAYGSFTIPDYPTNLKNNSQETCATPRDTTAPCAVKPTVVPPCNIASETDTAFFVSIQWQLPDCASDAQWTVIVRIIPSTNTTYILDTVPAGNMIYVFGPTVNPAGCYSILFIDSNGNSGPLVDTICVDNCPLYELPNAFSPNGDGINDIFTPFKPFRFIDSVDCKIFTRWGTLVYETSNPHINWNGNNLNGKPVPPGTYYYVCRVFETRLNGTTETDKPLSGYIYLTRD